MSNARQGRLRYRYTKSRYRVLFSILDKLCSPLFRLQPANTDRGRCWFEPRSILVVQLDHIGDSVLTTPMLRELNKRFPTASIDVLASESNQELFRANGLVQRVHVSYRNWHSRGAGRQSWLPEVLRLARLIRPHRYDWGVDPRGDFLIMLMLWLAAIPRRVGWTCGGGGFLMTDTVAWDPNRHELDSRRALLAAVGIHPDPGQFRPGIVPSWADECFVRESLHSVTGVQSPLIVIHAGAGTPAKRWPASSWIKLVARLHEQFSGTIVLAGAGADRSVARRIARSNPHAVDWTGRLTLLQTAALCRGADLFIGCDSGPAHIAAAVDVPTVVLFSGTNRAECWAPAGRFVRVVRHPVPCAPCHRKSCPVAGHPCMQGIAEHTVVAAALRLFEKSLADKKASYAATS